MRLRAVAVPPSDLIGAALSLPLACLLLLVRRNNAAHSCMCRRIHPWHAQCETSLQVPWLDVDSHCVAQKTPVNTVDSSLLRHSFITSEPSRDRA